MRYGSKLQALIADALDEFDELIEDDPDDIGDLIFQIADGWTPIYNAEILEVVSEEPHLWNREPDIIAFDGRATPANIGAGIIYEVLSEELYKHADERESILSGEDEEE